jgi:hypothetical protein
MGFIDECPSRVPQFDARSTILSKGIRDFSGNEYNNKRKLCLDASTAPRVLRVKGLAVANASQLLGVLIESELRNVEGMALFIYRVWHWCAKLQEP